MTFELVGDNDITYRGIKWDGTRKYKIKCRICGSENTKIDVNGKHVWIRDKDVKGNWTGFICYECNFRKEKKCSRCGNYSIDTLKRYDNKGLWTGEYICNVCFQKLKSKCRNKALSRSCTLGKRFIGQQIVAKVRGLKNCNIEMDHFNYWFDFCDPEYSRIKVRVATLKFNKWSFSTDGMENCDTIFLMCMDRNWKNVERVYIIPGGDIQVSFIYVYDNPPIIKPFEYDKFRANEDIYNDAYHRLKLDDCPVLKKD